MKLTTRSAEETLAFGRFLGEQLVRGDVVALDAPLGGGKTVMAKGLVQGLLRLNTDTVTSPAFTLVNEYSSDEILPTVYHMDFYRLDELGEDEFEIIDEYLADRNGVVIAEWGSKFLPSLSKNYIKISIDYTKADDPDQRTIEVGVAGSNERYVNVLSEIAKYVDAHS